MIEHYVTIFDLAFLAQGLALHSSLKQHAGPFVLWVVCMDEEVKRQLDLLGLPTIKTLALAEVETPELCKAKQERSRGEYCWTITPFSPKFVFDADPKAGRVTYVDADIYLFKSPKPIFEEFERSGKAVLITDHGYDPQYDLSAKSGRFCVQFVTFVRGYGEPVRSWWESRCLEWCFAKYENDRFGDQKYLDRWPEMFSRLVHVVGNLNWFMAPWNARRYPLQEAIVWHFHGLRILPNRQILLFNGYSIPREVERTIYRVYVEEIERQISLIGREIVQSQHGLMSLLPRSLWRQLRYQGTLARDFRIVKYRTLKSGTD